MKINSTEYVGILPKKACSSGKEPQSFATLNFWFDDFHQEERTRAMCKLVLDQDFDILFVQEIHRDVVNLVVSLLKAKYFTSETHATTILKNGYGCMVFANRRLTAKGFEGRFVPFHNTHMSRGMAILQRESEIYISTHLESYQTDQMKAVRVNQLHHMSSIAKNFDTVVIGLDSNTRGELIGMSSYIDWILPLKIDTWFGSRFFNNDGKACFDRILTKNIKDATVSIVDCTQWSDHDCVVLKR